MNLRRGRLCLCAAAAAAVPPEFTLTEALAQAGVAVPTSCEQGVCGASLTRVLLGRRSTATPSSRRRSATMGSRW